MSGRADSDSPPDTRTEEAEEVEEAGHGDGAGAAGRGEQDDRGDRDDQGQDAQGAWGDQEDQGGEARRARWAATGTGAALALAGTAASLLRLTDSVPALVPVAYACGAGTCALAAVLGSRGRTRRALWLSVAGLMVMALGDQFD
ncbi:hypothetical protein [Streptomyces prasinopilosus]|uniref:Uncharacterized protein n=1 Tax=Streptomyces prasinopilosus TaxID=67344 RepID=A0A1G7AZ23_9ACTN|nr:hypothetical protein [Streptomyces prasinopilosus]SDE19910.1 hypothetical protein SAMN05216505_12047 [Streptomyces prasinopilosus]